MPNCFTCRRPCKTSSVRLHVCEECVGRSEGQYAVTPWTPFERASLHPDVMAEGFNRCFKNSRYTVLWRDVQSPVGDLVHLSIKRNDKHTIHDWRDLQRIKNELLGHEQEAMELYPAESRLIDTANQYHLWCFRGMRAPFGYEAERCVMEDVGKTGGRQRPFEEKPSDLMTEEQWESKRSDYIRKKMTSAGYRGQIQSILDEAADGMCQNPLMYHEPWECEKVKRDAPGTWCATCMAKLLKRLAAEGGVLS